MAKVHKIDLLQKPTKSKSILEDPIVCLSVDSEHWIFHIDGKMGLWGYLQCIIMFNLDLMGTPREQPISTRGQSHFAWHFDSLCFLAAFLFLTASRKKAFWTPTEDGPHMRNYKGHLWMCAERAKIPHQLCLPSPGTQPKSSSNRNKALWLLHTTILYHCNTRVTIFKPQKRFYWNSVSFQDFKKDYKIRTVTFKHVQLQIYLCPFTMPAEDCCCSNVCPLGLTMLHLQVAW